MLIVSNDKNWVESSSLPVFSVYLLYYTFVNFLAHSQSYLLKMFSSRDVISCKSSQTHIHEV